MSKKRLLIIEDDVDVSEMLVAFFSSQDYEVLHAEMGQEGIALARSKFPNLILLDIMLPDMVGFDVCAALRATNLTKYIPIIFLTQRDARADKVAGLELGADDYVTKPFDIEELRLRVQGSIRRATRDHLHETRTGLPTGPLIYDVYERIRDEEGWHCYDIEIEGYKAFRDLYGFLAAEEALSLGVQVLTQTVGEKGTSDDFIGSMRESGFVVFTKAEEADALVETLKNTFKERAETLYNFMDLDQGFVVLNPGSDEEEKAPLMHLTIKDYTPDEHGDTG